MNFYLFHPVGENIFYIKYGTDRPRKNIFHPTRKKILKKIKTQKQAISRNFNKIGDL